MTKSHVFIMLLHKRSILHDGICYKKVLNCGVAQVRLCKVRFDEPTASVKRLIYFTAHLNAVISDMANLTVDCKQDTRLLTFYLASSFKRNLQN